MRELKFRAWHPIAKTMLTEGSLSFDGVMTTHWSVDRDWIIEQYTGMKDKDGKEIYEGDILEYDGTITPIVWVENGWWLIDDGKETLPSVEWRKVVGNIHENPELLEAK